MKRNLNTIINFLTVTIILITAMSFTRKKIDLVPVSDQYNICNHQLLKNRNMISDTMNMVITRTLEASLEQVWKAWSNEELVKQWWGPKGFTYPFAKLEFREGGTSLVCMRAPKEFGGQDMYNTWSYQKIVPMKRIEYILNFTDKDGNKLDPSAIGMPPGIPKNVPHIITFKDLGNNKTEVTVTEYGYFSAQVVELSKAGKGECLDKMAEALAKHQ